MRLVWRSADGAEQKDLGKVTQEPKSFKCTNMLVLFDKKKMVTRGWRLDETKKKKKFSTANMPETKPPQMFMLSWIYIGFTSKSRANWTEPLWGGLVNQRDSCNVTFNPNKNTWMQPMIYTNWVFFSIGNKRSKRRKSQSSCWVHTPLFRPTESIDLKEEEFARLHPSTLQLSFFNNIMRPITLREWQSLRKPSYWNTCRSSEHILSLFCQ